MGISSPPVQAPVPETPTSSAALTSTVPTNAVIVPKSEGAVPEMKWSSPSSVDSIGQKTDSTAGLFFLGVLSLVPRNRLPSDGSLSVVCLKKRLAIAQVAFFFGERDRGLRSVS